MSKPISYCSFDGCGKRAFGNGYCQKHYMRLRRKGTLETSKIENGARKAWADSVALCSTGDDCVIFPFPVGSHGYGEVINDGSHVLMHRYVCEKATGTPPTPSHQAAHNCGNRLCGNPRHLRWATVAENAADKIMHGRHIRGEKHGKAKLTNADVIAIRRMPGRQSDIAKNFAIVQQTVSDIKLGKRWSWL